MVGLRRCPVSSFERAERSMPVSRVMSCHEIRQLLGNLLPDLTVLRAFLRGKPALAGDTPHGHRRTVYAAIRSASTPTPRISVRLFQSL
jgi:hypothetical protein